VDLPAATSIKRSAFEYTGNTTLTVTLGNAVPALEEKMFDGVSVTKNVTVKVPSAASAWSGKTGNFTGSDTSDNWGNGFRGGGWNQDSSGIANSLFVNNEINLTVTAIP
jgi:hypothetical protein